MKDKRKSIHKESYEFYVEKFKEVYLTQGKIKSKQLTKNNYGLPTANWFIFNCPDKKVKTYNQFLIYCGFRPHSSISKDLVVDIVLEMQSKLDRPISAEDFKSPKDNEVGIRIIRRIWGEVWKMQQELGLQITGKHADKYTIDEITGSLIKICEDIYNNEKRKIITYDEIRKYGCIAINIYQSYLNKELNMTLRQYLNSIGFDMPREGNGLNFTYEDGEKIRSYYELLFSNYLRNILNIQFNNDYYRDVKYKTFLDCERNIDCDYIIHYKNRVIYLEIVGILKPEKKLTYKNETYIHKSKEKYRQGLIEKENLLLEAGLEYYILFSDDLNEEIYKKIFN